MIRYKNELEDISRRFCPEISECEWLIWSRLSKRQHIFTPRQSNWPRKCMACSIKNNSTLRMTFIVMNN